MNEVGTVGLDEVGESTRTANACHSGHFFMMEPTLLYQLEIEGKD